MYYLYYLDFCRIASPDGGVGVALCADASALANFFDDYVSFISLMSYATLYSSPALYRAQPTGQPH